MFNLAVLGGLYRKVGDDKADIYLESTSLKLQFDTLNNYEKYYFLLEIFWTKFDFMKLILWGTGTSGQFTKTISESKTGQILVKGSFSKRSDSWEFLVQLVAIDENEKEIKQPLITEIKGDAQSQFH